MLKKKSIHFNECSHDQFVAEDPPKSVTDERDRRTCVSHSTSKNFHELRRTSSEQDNVWKSPFFSCDVLL